MDKTQYVQFTHAQQEAQTRIDEQRLAAWRWIVSRWQCPEWTRVDAWVRIALNLPQSLGMCSGMLVTQAASVGIGEFVARMNRPRKS